MKILIEIPEEYEQEYEKDKFSDCFNRIYTDLINKNSVLVGSYEIETLLMLCESFKNSKTVTFVEHPVLEKINYGLFKNDERKTGVIFK